MYVEKPVQSLGRTCGDGLQYEGSTFHPIKIMYWTFTFDLTASLYQNCISDISTLDVKEISVFLSQLNTDPRPWHQGHLGCLKRLHAAPTIPLPTASDESALYYRSFTATETSSESGYVMIGDQILIDIFFISLTGWQKQMLLRTVLCLCREIVVKRFTGVWGVITASASMEEFEGKMDVTFKDIFLYLVYIIISYSVG